MRFNQRTCSLNWTNFLFIITSIAEQSRIEHNIRNIERMKVMKVINMYVPSIRLAFLHASAHRKYVYATTYETLRDLFKADSQINHLSALYMNRGPLQSINSAHSLRKFALATVHLTLLLLLLWGRRVNLHQITGKVVGISTAANPPQWTINPHDLRGTILQIFPLPRPAICYPATQQQSSLIMISF